MEYDFDRAIDRSNSDSLKWRDTRDNDVIPMWVADMDFASPPCVLRAMRERVDHGVFGYSVPTDAVNLSVVAWALSHYDWPIDPEWIVWLPGLVPGIHVACQACAAAGEEVLTFIPVYPPFLSAPLARERAVRKVPLTQQGSRWIISIEELDKAVTSQTRLLLLCNPHNPVGRAFGYEELVEVAELCQRHNLLVCSDEIHCDLKLTTERHIPFASLSEEIANRSITLMSPAKTFNTTGLNCGFAVIPNADLRQRFQNVASGIVPQPNGLGYAACRAAFEEGEAWRRDLISYLRGNRDLLESFLSEKLPMFSMSHVEATYLAWIDTRWLGKRNAMSFFEMAGVQLSDGTAFGGRGFVRFNFGCPRERLTIALERIHQAVQSVGKSPGFHP